MRRPGLLSFGVGLLLGFSMVSFVFGSGPIDTWSDYLGSLAIAFIYQQWIWPLILGWRPGRGWPEDRPGRG